MPNVLQFKQKWNTENGKLIAHCAYWQKYLSGQFSNNTLPENVLGDIRTAIGLTELLLEQKLKQFKGLISDCENGTGEIRVTCSDLQGFWEMVYHEVEKVNNTFKTLEDMEKNNWEIKEEEPVIPVKKMKLSKPKTNIKAEPSAAMKAHILAARQRLAEAKANAKMKFKQNPAFVSTGKENSICVSAADSTVDDAKLQTPDFVTITKAQKSDANQSTTPSRSSGRSRKNKEIIPLSCVTRSASKRALRDHNKA